MRSKKNESNNHIRKNYTLSNLIKDATDILKNNGDIPVAIDILTENQSNLISIAPGLDEFDDLCLVTVDLEDNTTKEFKKNIK